MPDPHVMAGFAELGVHPDVPDGIRTLADSSMRLATLSNGSTSVAEGLFERAGIRHHFEALLSVEGVSAWKPAPDAYAAALRTCDVAPERAMLVAVHPWDVDGAIRAVLAAAWIDRAGGHYPEYFTAPTIHAGSLTELADRLA